MLTAMVNMIRTFEQAEADTPGYIFSGKHLAQPHSHVTIEVETNSDDLLEVKELAEIAVENEYPGWKFNYLKVRTC